MSKPKKALTAHMVYPSGFTRVDELDRLADQLASLNERVKKLEAKSLNSSEASE